MAYAELQISSNFSFLRGASHPEELVEQAAALQYHALAITDRNSFAGIVRAHQAAKQHGIRLIPACRLELMDGPALLAYPRDAEAYGRLCTLLSLGNMRAEKGACHLYKKDVYAHAEGSLFIATAPDLLGENRELDPSFRNALEEYKEALGGSLYLGIHRSFMALDTRRMALLRQLAVRLRIPLAATNNVYYHHPDRRELQDILTCIREKCRIQDAGFLLHPNAERYLKPVPEIQRLMATYPEALANSLEIASACRFSLDQLKYLYPEEITSEGRTPMEELTYLTWKGAEERFGGSCPESIRETIRMELDFIRRKDYASYFLTVYDYVREAKRRNILCQGRGSAANSVVCYCLGITAVDPTKMRLLFARFMSDAREEPPDIDVDFEHEHREEMMQYIYEKYGRDRAGIVATVTQVHWKGAVRDVGKAMGLSVDAVNHLASSGYEFTEEWFAGRKTSSEGFDSRDPHLRKTIQLTLQYIGFPRQLGQHTGGFVITRGKLTRLCPVLRARMPGRTCIEWNKDDIDALGFMKVDVLALGMLTCIRKAFDLIRKHYGRDYNLFNIPADDPEVYRMISAADTIGVFQIESRAQMSMLPRLKPKCFYDLVIEVAIVRPGPIQGDMVHPYLRRRNGEEPIEYPSEEIQSILERTLGVPLFQEQAMEIAIVAAGFSPADADGLRRSMATFKAHGKISAYEQKLIQGMVSRGYKEEFARRVFRQLEGFGSYGFPESHAASFALLVYISAWIKYHYPDVFAAALLNSLPMGFYQPAQIVQDAHRHGVEIREADINHSEWDHTLEPGRQGSRKALRLGFRLIKGLREQDIQTLLHNRKDGYRSVVELAEAGLPPQALEKLAMADAFQSLGLNRREALWEVAACRDRPLGLYKGQSTRQTEEERIRLPAMSRPEHVWQDYASTTLSLKDHPVRFVRPQLNALRVTRHADLPRKRNGERIRVAGLVLVRQRPGTASGICFITLEDETGIANLVVFEQIFHRFRKEILKSRLLMAEGRLQIEGEVIHLVVDHCYNLNQLLNKSISAPADAEYPIIPSRADEKDSEHPEHHPRKKRTARQIEIFPSGRNFH